MAATIARVQEGENVSGKWRQQVVDVTGDSSYPAGGYAIVPGKVGFKRIHGAMLIGGNAEAARYQAHWDTTNGKLIIAYPSGGGAASPAALADPAIAAGGVAVTSIAANGATDLVPGRGKELLAATDVTTLRFRMLFIGV